MKNEKKMENVRRKWRIFKKLRHLRGEGGTKYGCNVMAGRTYSGQEKSTVNFERPSHNLCSLLFITTTKEQKRAKSKHTRKNFVLKDDSFRLVREISRKIDRKQSQVH